MQTFDAHFHIIDPRFPLVANKGFLPDPYTVADYRVEAANLSIAGGAVVSGSFQAFDQSYLIDALKALGPGFVGVTQLPETVGDDEILALGAAGVRAIRFNLYRGGSAAAGALETMARRVHDVAGWHVEIYADAAALADIAPLLRRLPRVSVDHLGLSAEGLPTLLGLAGAGIAVKATGFGRVTMDVPDALRAIHAANPEALMFGTDLPSTRTRRFASGDVDLIVEALGQEACSAVFHDNAAKFYRLGARKDRL